MIEDQFDESSEIFNSDQKNSFRKSLSFIQSNSEEKLKPEDKNQLRRQTLDISRQQTFHTSQLADLTEKTEKHLKKEILTSIIGVGIIKGTKKHAPKKFLQDKSMLDIIPPEIKNYFRSDKQTVKYTNCIINEDVIEYLFDLRNLYVSDDQRFLIIPDKEQKLEFRNIEKIDNKSLKSILYQTSENVKSKIKSLIFQKSAKFSSCDNLSGKIILDNQIFGNLSEFVTMFSNLQKLEILDFKDSEGLFFKELVLPNLKELILANNTVCKHNCVVRFNEFIKKSNLETSLIKLGINNWQISDVMAEKLFKGLKFNLKYFYFRDIEGMNKNQFQIRDAVNNQNLKILDISGQQPDQDTEIYSNCLISFFTNFKKAKLTDLFINNIDIDWDFCKVLHDCLTGWNLETFSIKNSLREDKVTERLFNGLNLHELKWFEASDNDLGADGCLAIHSCLSRANLDYLEMVNCKLTEKKVNCLFNGLDLCWFKTKDSINLDKNTLVSGTGLQIINNAVINSGFVLSFEDLGINVKTEIKERIQNQEELFKKFKLSQKRSLKEDQRAIQIKHWPRDDKGLGMDLSREPKIGQEFNTMVSQVQVINDKACMLVARDGFDWMQLGSMIINKQDLFLSLSKKLDLQSLLDIGQGKRIMIQSLNNNLDQNNSKINLGKSKMKNENLKRTYVPKLTYNIKKKVGNEISENED